MFTFSFQTRDFSSPLALPGLAWTVERMAWQAVGGPAEARLRVTGSVERLFDLAERLRCPVTIHDDLGPCWWGYLSAVTFYGGPAPLRIDLEAVANRVAVSYQEITPHEWGGPRVMTEWREDAASVAAYGSKERLYQVGPSSAADAGVLAAAMLGQYGKPCLVPLAAGPREAERQETPAGGWRWAEVEAQGWWSTLGWRYYAEPRGRAGHLTVGTAYTWGSSTANAKVAGSFQCGQAGAEGWSAAEAWVRLRRYRATDYVRLELCADQGGTPGGVLASTSGAASASLPASALADDWTWARFAFPGPVALSPGVTYWLVLSRTGALSGTQYFAVSVDEGLGYPAGVFRVWNGTGWAARSPDADLNFLVSGAEATTAQAARMLASSPFFRHVRIEQAAGTLPGAVSARLYRDGSRRALEEVEDLLQLGLPAADGGVPVRLLAAVEPDRTARVYPCPSAPAGVLGADGSPAAESGRPLRPSDQPCGRWLRLPEGRVGQVFAEAVVWEDGRLRVNG